MLTVALGLLSALVVGAADFTGGYVSRRASALRLAAAAQLVGMPFVLGAALVAGATRVTGRDVVWSLASGVVVGAGVACFYRAMARGVVSVVAPLTAVIGALVPVVYALVRGERPGWVVILGIALAVVAIGLVSASGGSGESFYAGLDLAVAAGLFFGAFYVCLALTGEDAGLWPAALSRVGSSALLVVLALTVTHGVAAGPGTMRPVIAIAVLEVIATITLLLAIQRGPVSVATVSAALYPVVTTILAWMLLHERLRPLQWFGVGLALTAVVLISAG